MNARRVGCVAAGVFVLGAGAASASPRLTLVPASSAVSTVRSYTLTLPSARSLTVSQVEVTQNGRAVRDLTLTPVDATAGAASDAYLLKYRSSVNPETRVLVGVRVRGIADAATSTYVSPSLHLTPARAFSAPPPPKRTFWRSPEALGIVVAILAAIVVAAVALLLRPRRQPVIDRIRVFVELGHETAESSGDAANPNGLLSRAQASIESEPWSARLGEALALANISIPTGKFVLGVSAAAVLGAALGNVLFGPIGLIVGMALAPIVARTYVKRALKRNRKAFADQLPDSLDVLASALRAGHSLVGGLSVVANDASEPTRTEFRRVLAEEQLGVQIEDALLVTAARMANRDIEQLSLVARLQREMGANTAEVLDRVVETVRGRMELRRLVGSLTAQGRLSRWILTLMPVGLSLLIEVIDPSYMTPLFSTTMGEALLGVALVMVTLGSLAIGKIVDIKA